MKFEQMVMYEPELLRLEASAENAGRHQATWMATLQAIHETLSKCCGSDASLEELRTPAAYEVARAALFASWAKGNRLSANTPLKRSDEPRASPAAPGTVDQQQTFLDTSQPYR